MSGRRPREDRETKNRTNCLKYLHMSKKSSNFAAGSCKDMNEQYPTAYCVASNYLEDRGWSELIDPRWAPQLLEEFRHSGLGWTDEEIIEVVNEVLFGKAEWDSTDRIEMREVMWPTRQEQINTSITYNGFSAHTLQLIDNYTNDILYGRTNLDRFNQQEHAGLCSGGAPLIGAYIVCCYARASFESGRFSLKCQEAKPSNWEIDAKQEEVLQQWAEAKQLWFPHSEQLLTAHYGPKIAQQAEAKVYYRAGDTSVIKERTSIYATLGKALEAIILHNSLFPETRMKVIGFTRDSDGLFRIILTQQYIACKRLATKAEIDDMVAAKGFQDNKEGEGVNYIGDRMYLEDMHPANVFIDATTNQPTCIDCIVKFIKKE